jgi:hypothetical protein
MIQIKVIQDASTVYWRSLNLVQAAKILISDLCYWPYVRNHLLY